MPTLVPLACSRKLNFVAMVELPEVAALPINAVASGNAMLPEASVVAPTLFTCKFHPAEPLDNIVALAIAVTGVPGVRAGRLIVVLDKTSEIVSFTVRLTCVLVDVCTANAVGTETGGAEKMNSARTKMPKNEAKYFPHKSSGVFFFTL